MENKPSYEELEERLVEQEKEIASLRATIEKLRESEEKFKTMFENANDHIAYVDLEDRIIDVNHKFEEIFGHNREDVIGKKFYEFSALTPEASEKSLEYTRKLIGEDPGQNPVLEFEAFDKNGNQVYLEVNPRAVVKDGKVVGFLSITRDITERKRAEEALHKHQDELERLVKERTANLEEANTALRVMLKKAEEVRAEMGERIQFNIREFAFPYLERLKKTDLDNTQKAYLENLEENLNEITSPFMQGISTKYMRLTPTEIQVANMVKQGKSTKEIAELLSMSFRTIETHRYNIRAKLGLKNQKANLRTYLLSFN
ncbi:MAG: PAS domain S-box protein [Dehalococcoidia bacterium]